ncbi:putative transcriptional regulator, LysR family [Luminiphilus syltensis NOR5-1B]|uniref:Putative transcriptional regulator, LysR family n=1 Tax=Luminiphilus syltensis NOR5-1B TaxID=565045 RepID=B8KV86_9GAMM|nr:LysR family transcriptional regulator [Luminiphilus syltensis]EED35011.1 putative transcriptional regulator, LysR family [Luminiphilus syltensis NOR5-1B]
MNLRSVDLNLLTIFDAIVSEGNLTHAADKIGMSQPAISAALGRLRVTLDDELFVSTGRGVKPTQRALQLQEPVRRILEDVRAALTSTGEFDPESSDRVFTISSIDYGGIVVIPRLLRYLQKQQSPIIVNINPSQTGEAHRDVDRSSGDLTITSDPLLSPDHECKLLRRELPYCLARKDHPDITGSLSVEQFQRNRHVLLYSNNTRGLALDAHLLQLGFNRECGARVPSFFNMPYIVGNTDMICTMPRQMAEDFARQFGLQVLAAPFDNWTASYFMVWHRSFNGDSGHCWLRDSIFRLCSDTY